MVLDPNFNEDKSKPTTLCWTIEKLDYLGEWWNILGFNSKLLL